MKSNIKILVVSVVCSTTTYFIFNSLSVQSRKTIMKYPMKMKLYLSIHLTKFLIKGI